MRCSKQMAVNGKKNTEVNHAQPLGPGSLTPVLTLLVAKTQIWLRMGKQG